MKFSELLERYVFVRKCVACGERLGYEYRNEAFCDACRISFERAKSENCPSCMSAVCDCRCIPKRLSENGIIGYRKLFFYRGSKSHLPENKLVYFLKNNKSLRVAHFVAEQLSFRLDELISDEELSRDELIITYLPRSRRAYATYGVDQAEIVAGELGKISHVECLPLIKRVRDGGSSQKKLTVRQRLQNTRGMFKINEKCASAARGRAVIIYDDVVTSAVSVSRVAALLKKGGSEKIYVFSLAYTATE